MEPFLKTVANTYLNREPQQLADYTFVFPNRRSSLFFAKHIKTIATGKAMIMPEITTISDFISEFSGIEEASSIELLFLLYKEYKKLRMVEGAEEGTYSFDKFLFIGNIIIQDFNDIDLFNADAEQVLKNTSELKEIKSTYLSKELVEILNQYFNISNLQENSESDSFWTHVKGDKKISKKYLSLWKMLYPLYTELRKSLKEIGKGYSGLIYRTALDNILKMSSEDFHSSRYIFVGFNALSTTEFLIFNKMKNLGIADFYWDFNCEIVKKASAFMEENTKHFPSRYNINESGTIAGEINVYGIPSNSGQLKYAAEITKKIYNEKEDVATAIVLPNEALYLPALSMIPQLGIDKVNVTFGIPLKNTSVAILMSKISTMHSHARSINGVMQFRKEDVVALMAFQIVKNLDKEKAAALEQNLTKLKSLFVPSETLEIIKESNLATIFRHVEKLVDRNEVFKYIRDLIDTLDSSLPEQSFDKIYIEAYREATQDIENAITILGNEEIGINSMFYLVDRLVATLSHNLKGEPLRGLQIMGFLESRCLDFKNVIITSVNEKILPKKSFNQSFIPGHIRKAYGIATNEFQESLYSYYFYRLISRAENVYLLYDSRKQSFGAGEYSRYIYQLKYLHDGIKIHFFNPKFARKNENRTCATTPAADASDPNSIRLQKDDRIMEIIRKFFDVNEKTNYKFSASAFKEYINCPLNFYFEYIEGLRFEDHEDSLIDSATFGTIVHDVLSKIYEINKEYKDPQDFVSLKAKVPDAINNAINEIYLKRPLGTPLEGSAKFIYSIVAEYVNSTIDYDAKSAPFTIIEMEKKYDDGLDIDEKTHINFSFTIDRLQERNGSIEIIDYKTGSDTPSVADIESIKDPQNYKKHSIFQLLLYCEAYLQKNPNEKRSIIPKMYSMREIFKDLNYRSTIKINRQEINYNNEDTRGEFIALFNGIIAEITDPDTPFSQVTGDKSCSFCGFKEICRK